MVQAITTKYFGPGAIGSRIKATSGSGIFIYTDYDDGLSSEENHRQAVRNLCKKIGWTGKLVPGFIKNGNENVFVFIDKGEDILEVE